MFALLNGFIEALQVMRLELSVQLVLLPLRVLAHIPEKIFEATLILVHIMAGQTNLSSSADYFQRGGLIHDEANARSKFQSPFNLLDIT